jgi:hypothetical protein
MPNRGPKALQDAPRETREWTGFHTAPTQWALRCRNRGLSPSNPILITHLRNLSIYEVDLKHIFR